jgi:hypothetical protein
MEPLLKLLEKQVRSVVGSGRILILESLGNN